MPDNDESNSEKREIREVAREQLDTERQGQKMRQIMSQMSEQLVDDAAEANSIKEKRMALEEVRKVNSDIEEQKKEQKQLSEIPLEDLFSELVQLAESADEERDSSESQTA